MRFFNFLLILISSLQVNAQDWQLVWSDEFSGSNLDATKWTHSIGTGDWGWGNGELQYYQSENATISNGKLIIEARQEPQGIPGQWNVPYYYSSSKITTYNKFDFRYGKVEARIKSIDGEGFWPAFWLLPNGGCWPENGEIDIMEQWGNDGPTNETSGAVHVGDGCQGASNYQSWNSTIDGSFADNYHTYSIIWYEDYVGWYVDDVLHHYVTPTSFSGGFEWPFNQDDWYIILNLAITNSGPNDNTTFPSDIMVDYVRVYQTSDVMGCMNPASSNYSPEATLDDGSCVEFINFNVDMNCSGENPDVVYISGPFNNWCGECNPMSDDDGDGIWSATYSFEDNDGQLEYKYSFDNWAGQENLVDDVQNGNGSCVEVTDYSSYANRMLYLYGSDITTNDVYGQCSECIAGCTDATALNYNSAANFDDGSCDYECIPPQVTFSVNMEGPLPDGYSNVVINGSWNGWQGWGITLQDDNNDNIWEGTANLPTGSNEYVFAYTGQADNWSGWGVVGGAPIGSSCDFNPVDEYGNYGFNLLCGDNIQLSTVCFSSCENCLEPISGCTDSSADNYNPEAVVEDGSCTYCGDFQVFILGTSLATAPSYNNGSIQATAINGSGDYNVEIINNSDGSIENPFALSAGDYTVVVEDLSSACQDMQPFTIQNEELGDNPCDITPTGLFVDNIIHNRVVFNWSAPTAAPSHYMLRYREVGTSSWTVMSAGPVNSNAFTGNSRTRYFMEPGTTYQWNIRARVLNEDGSTNCQSPWSASSQYTTLDACANLENLSASTEAVWATLSADAPAADWGVWQSKGKMRVVGTNSFRYVNGASDGSISVLKGNFEPSTDYEWHTKAWCTGNVDANGDSDPQYHSGWGEFSTFSTQDPCDKMPTNLSTSSNGANTAITMSWDTPESGQPDHYFLELTNVTTGQVWAWNNLAGSLTSKTKFGLTAGEYSWKIRGACGTNGTSWATIFSSSVEYTLGGARLENNSVTNLDVYPNPSRDIFSVTFTSEEPQDIIITVVNMLSELVFVEEFKNVKGRFTQQIDLDSQSKGIYSLKISNSSLNIYKRIALQ
jgi:beta-glucanase (GH16 family)